MKLFTVIAVLTSLTASVSGFPSHRPVYERDLNGGTHLLRGDSIQARGNYEDAVLALRNFERKTALFEDDDIIYRRALLEGHIVLKARAAAKAGSSSPRAGSPSGGSSSADSPSVPAGKDATKVHVWTRLDTRKTTYDNRAGPNHDGLNQLIKDTGGRHVDVVIGNPTKGFNEYGLKFSDPLWQQKANGDGAAVEVYALPFEPTQGQTFTYQGQLDGRATINTVKAKG